MRDLKIGVIGIPGKWSTETLADAIEERTGFRLVIDMADVTADITRGRLTAQGVDLCELDGLVVKKISQQYSPSTLDRIEMLRLAERAGDQVFSRVETIIRMIDRLSCTVTLRNGDIPMPETVVTESCEEAFNYVVKFAEAVFKPLFSTKAQGMEVIGAGEPETVIRSRIEQFKRDNPMIYIQRKIDLRGRDFGMVFLGGNYLGSYARVAEGESWSTTIDSGGRYAPHEPPRSTIDLAARAQALFGMAFTTVDVADTEDGPVVFEVSAFGGFRGAKEGIGIDAAALYADHIMNRLES